MDREEAQYILQLCRPDNSEDRNDPLIAEALELLNQDAELRAWFEEQQALDTKSVRSSTASNHLPISKPPFWPACVPTPSNRSY